MGILGRIADLFRVKARQRREAREDPNDALDRSYEEMLTGLQETKRKLADAMAQQKMLERQIAGSSTNARPSLQASLDALSPQVEQLVDYQRKLAERVERLRIQKDTLRASTAAAEAELKITQSLAGFDGQLDKVSDAHRRAEDKMLDARAKAKAMDRMIRDGVLADPLDEASYAARETAALRDSGSVDEGRTLPSGPVTPKAIAAPKTGDKESS